MKFNDAVELVADILSTMDYKREEDTPLDTAYEIIEEIRKKGYAIVEFMA